MVRRIVLILFVFLGITWLGGRYLLSPRIEVIHPNLGPAVEAVYATGTVEGSSMFPLAPRISAKISELLADEGQTVVAGQILAKLEDEEFHHAVGELKARAQFLKTEFERQSNLLKSKVSSQESYQRAKADWEAQESAIRVAEARADYMLLKAPGPGTIIKRDGEIGELISADQAVFWINSDSALRISAEVDEEDIPIVALGQTVLIRSDAFPNQTFKGIVKSITPKGDPIQRSYRVRIHFQEPTSLKIGMTAENNIIIRESQNALLIPSSAIRAGSVWRVRDGNLEQVSIGLGSKGLEKSEVTSGLSADDFVVLKPEPQLTAGTSVRIKLIDN